MNKLKRPILRYHGGKWLLAPWIISRFPPHKCYTEVFGGAASVLLRKPRSYAEVYNDKWETVVNVFRCMQDELKAKELRRLIELTPYARAEFDLCGEMDIRAVKYDVERARRTIARSFMGFGSASTNAEHSTGFRSNSKRSGSTPAHDWMNYPNYIDSFTNRLRGVIIENGNYWKIMQTHDAATTLHYVDPPYVWDTRNLKRGNAMYAFELTAAKHMLLAKRLKSLKGMVVLSGYQCTLYWKLYEKAGWTRFDKNTHADGAKDRVESLWLNPAAMRAKNSLFQ